MQLSFPNPAQLGDVMTSLEQLLSGARLPAPGITVTPTGGSATTQTYVVVAKSNGAIVPSAKTSTTVGAATLSSTAYNTLVWNIAVDNLTNLTWDVYRTVGGTTQGKIASNLTVQSLVDSGLAGDGTTPPGFNNTGILAAGGINPLQMATGSTDAIVIPQGHVIITTASADALTLPLPIAGAASAGGMDGCSLNIISMTAYAHTITTSANGFNGATHIATASAAALNKIKLVAYNGTWEVVENTNFTLS